MASDDEAQRSGSFRVQDRRRFDSEGNERQGDSAPEPKPAPAKGTADKTPEPKPSPQKLEEERSTNPDSGAAGVDEERFDDARATVFSALVTSLATQALMQLGEIPTPEGVELPIDREAAQYTIDILQTLQEKTRGNLDPGEDRLLIDILHNLRMVFVRERRKGSSPF